MVFDTVFSAADAPLRNLWFPTVGLLFASLGIAAVFRPAVLNKQFSRSKFLRWYFLIFGSGWTIAMAIYVVTDNYNAVQALHSGNYRVLQGRVANFVPMPWQGHADEHFTVDGVPFAYSDYEITAGFNRSSSHGGPVREGLPVRIAYRGGEILRLEVGR